MGDIESWEARGLQGAMQGGTQQIPEGGNAPSYEEKRKTRRHCTMVLECLDDAETSMKEAYPDAEDE